MTAPRNPRRFWLTAKADTRSTPVACGGDQGHIDIALRNPDRSIEYDAIKISIFPDTDSHNTCTRVIITYTNDDGTRQSITLRR